MKHIKLILVTAIILNGVAIIASQSTEPKIKMQGGTSQVISEKDISEAIGLLNTAQGGLFPAGEPGTTNAFTQFRDPVTVGRWNTRIREVEDVVNNLLNSKLVQSNTRTVLLAKLRELHYISNSLISTLNTVFKQAINPILPPNMILSSDKETPVGVGKLKELKLAKVNFTKGPKSVASIVGDQINKLMSDLVNTNKALASLRKDKTNARNTNKALDLMLGLGRLEEAQLIIILKDYINLLFERIFTQGGILYIASDPDLEKLWRARLEDLKTNSILLDKTYAPLAEKLVKEHTRIIDIIKAKEGADQKNRQMKTVIFNSWPQQAQLVYDSVNAKLPDYAHTQKLSESSQDALLLIKKLNNLLKNLIVMVEAYNH